MKNVSLTPKQILDLLEDGYIDQKIQQCEAFLDDVDPEDEADIFNQVNEELDDWKSLKSSLESSSSGLIPTTPKTRFAENVAETMIGHYWNHNVVTDGRELGKEAGFTDVEINEASKIDLENDTEFKTMVIQSIQRQLDC